MQAYIIRRLALMIPTLFLVTIVVFLTIRLVPGNVIDLMLYQQQGRITKTELTIEALRHKLELDVPVHVQYGRWVGRLFHGDFGNSLWTERPVMDEILGRLPVTFELGFLALVIAQLIALPIGIYSAVRQDTSGDYIGRGLAIGALAIPGFWLATMVMVFPSIWWGWSPPVKLIPFTEDPLGNLGQFIIPAFLMGLAMSGVTMRMLRTTMLEVLRQDYIRTSWAKGLRERTIVSRHAMKNALIPVVTIIAGQAPIMFGGMVIIEQIFSLPGIGRLFFDALVIRDYPYISAINVLLATVGVLIILITDLSYAYLDPRVRYK